MRCPNCGEEMDWIEKNYEKGNILKGDFHNSKLYSTIQLTVSYYCYDCCCKIEVEYPHKEVQE